MSTAQTLARLHQLPHAAATRTAYRGVARVIDLPRGADRSVHAPPGVPSRSQPEARPSDSAAQQAEARVRLVCLLQAVAAGDRGAFTELYEATSACLLGIATAVLGNQSLAEEALQDAYVNVWRHAAGFDPGVATPMTWLINIVRNRAIDIRRARAVEGRNTVTLDEDQLASLEATVAGENDQPDEQLGLRRAQSDIEAAMQTLSPEQRQAVALVIRRGLTHAEIAEQFGVPLSTAKTWVRRGLARLKDYAAREAGGSAGSVREPAGSGGLQSRGDMPKRALKALEKCE